MFYHWCAMTLKSGNGTPPPRGNDFVRLRGHFGNRHCHGVFSKQFPVPRPAMGLPIPFPSLKLPRKQPANCPFQELICGGGRPGGFSRAGGQVCAPCGSFQPWLKARMYFSFFPSVFRPILGGVLGGWVGRLPRGRAWVGSQKVMSGLGTGESAQVGDSMNLYLGHILHM